MSKKKKKNINVEKSVSSGVVNPEATDELLNAFGTYNIQPTCNTDNDFPSIAQGLPEEKK